MSSDAVPDIKKIIKGVARYVSENGIETEKEFLFPDSTRYSFMIRSDPNHGFYQRKLTEYQINGAGSGSDDEIPAVSTEIIQPPPGFVATLIERTARYVSRKGLEHEKCLMQSDVYNRLNRNPNYNFLRILDPYHAFYKQRLSEYCSMNPREKEVTFDSDDEAHCYAPVLPTDTKPPEYLDLPNNMLVEVPIGMTFHEFSTIKLAAMFMVWYGDAFWVGLVERAIPQLEFLKPDGKWFSCFSDFVLGYAQVLFPPIGLRAELRESAAYAAAIVDAFVQRLQWRPLISLEWDKAGRRAMVDWHDSVTKDFANKDEEPDQKRQKLEEPALVPEDQFLAQHQGSSTIKVSVPDADGGKVIEITVQSLSETVASLKEKIAHTHKLVSGKAGVLKDNDKSLAHYNVGPGDTLTLSTGN